MELFEEKLLTKEAVPVSYTHLDRSYAVIRLENSCLNKAVSGQGLFLTAKADRTRHGIGLKLSLIHI